jgi:hypothetical protein
VNEYFEMGYVKVHVMLGHSAKFACGRPTVHNPDFRVVSGLAVNRPEQAVRIGRAGSGSDKKPQPTTPMQNKSSGVL